MTTAVKLVRSTSVLRAKAVLLMGAPVMAMAAEQAIQHAAGIDGIAAATWGFLVLFCLLGWAVADLDEVAELWNPSGQTPYQIWKERLKLLKGMAASQAAGIGTYFLGKATPGMLASSLGIQAAGTAPPTIPEMALFVAVSGAAYMGTRWFAWIEKKVTGSAPPQ